MTITEFINARLDEDEAIAKAAMATDDPGGIRWLTDGTVLPRLSEATHIVQWGPARVLREVKAQRHLVDAHHPNHDPCDAHDPATMESEPCEVLVQFAAVHADHPDYRQEWAP